MIQRSRPTISSRLPRQEGGEQVAGVELSGALEQGQEHGLVRPPQAGRRGRRPSAGPGAGRRRGRRRAGRRARGRGGARSRAGARAPRRSDRPWPPVRGRGRPWRRPQPQASAVEVEEALVAAAEGSGHSVPARPEASSVRWVSPSKRREQARGPLAQTGRQRRLGTGVVGNGDGGVGKGAGAEGQGTIGQDLPGTPPGAADTRGPVVIDQPEGKALGIQWGHGSGRGLIPGLLEPAGGLVAGGPEVVDGRHLGALDRRGMEPLKVPPGGMGATSPETPREAARAPSEGVTVRWQEPLARPCRLPTPRRTTRRGRTRPRRWSRYLRRSAGRWRCRW